MQAVHAHTSWNAAVWSLCTPRAGPRVLHRIEHPTNWREAADNGCGEADLQALMTPPFVMEGVTPAGLFLELPYLA